MMKAFTAGSPYKKRARSMAIAWTLLILFLCFLPGKEIPNVHLPLADKWTHCVLFGVFSFLWLCARPSLNTRLLLVVFAASVAFGWAVEELQGILAFLGRSKDGMDIVADAIGGLIGIIVFAIMYRIAAKKDKQTQI